MFFFICSIYSICVKMRAEFVCLFSSFVLLFLNGKNNFSLFIRRQTNETVLCSFNFHKTTE